MNEYRGAKGKKYILEDTCFASGGEGRIYNIVGNSNMVAKIFQSKKRTNDRHEKIRAMLENKPDEKHLAQFAWPLDLLYKSNKFCGYVMNKVVNMVAINEIYSFDNKFQHDWSLMITIAKNLSAAIEVVHKSNHICGDLGPANIFIDNKTGFVMLLDTDSYCILDSKSNKMFSCNVGVYEFLPVELHGKNLNDAQNYFTNQSDYFALAIHIFSLLMNGSHPYACSVSTNNINSVDPSLLDNIKNRKSYFFYESSVFKPPRYAPSIDILPEYISSMFCNAFSGQIRPTAKGWYEVLEKLQNDIKCCEADSSHYYYEKLEKCPWCNHVNLDYIEVSQESHTERKKTIPSKKNKGVRNLIIIVILLSVLFLNIERLEKYPEEYNLNDIYINTISFFDGLKEYFFGDFKIDDIDVIVSEDTLASIDLVSIDENNLFKYELSNYEDVEIIISAKNECWIAVGTSYSDVSDGVGSIDSFMLEKDQNYSINLDFEELYFKFGYIEGISIEINDCKLEIPYIERTNPDKTVKIVFSRGLFGDHPIQYDNKSSLLE